MFWLLTLLAFSACTCIHGTKNIDVERKIDLRSHVVRVEHKITIDEVGNGYEFVLPVHDAAHLAYISASSNRGAFLKVAKVSEKANTYKLHLNSELRFTIHTVYIGHFQPKPDEVSQEQKHFVKFSGSAVFYSPYETVTQETSIIMPRGEVLSYNTNPSPVSKVSQKILYGPYKNQLPYSESPIFVHLEHYGPFLTVVEMTRHIEVSHWGNIAVEETLEIVNNGAKLRGSFSRMDYDMGIGRKSAIASFSTALPAAAKDIYYRDEIGNISTSTVKDLVDAMEVKLSPRFPLMGGWKTKYTLGYNVPAHEFLYHSGSDFALRMRFMDHVYDDQAVRRLKVKVVLPEMVTNIEPILPYPVRSENRETLKTYLDTVGRPVLVFEAENLVTEHIQDFTVKYRFNMLLMLREPFILVAAFSIVFFCAMVYVRPNFSIYHDEKSELRLRAQAMVDEVQDTFKLLTSLYQSFEDALLKYISNKDSSHFQKVRRDLETKHKGFSKILGNIQSKMSDLYVDGAEKTKDLLTLDQSYRELFQENVQLAERLISGSLPKARYQSTINELIAKKADVVHRMQAIVDSL